VLHTLQVVTNTSEEHKNRLREAAKGGGLLNAVRAAKSVRPHPNAKAQARPGEDEDTVVKVREDDMDKLDNMQGVSSSDQEDKQGNGKKEEL